MKLYRVIEDLQGGTFAMGIAQSATEWLDTMATWKDNDGTYDEEWTEEMDREYWGNLIAEGKEQELIDYIEEVWQLTFQMIDENFQRAYQDYKASFKPEEGEPVCFCEWLDNEAEELGLVPSSDNPEGAEYQRAYQNEEGTIIY